MAINLQKNQSINLNKEVPGLNHIFVGLGWDVNNGEPIDCDVSVFMLNDSHKIPTEGHFVFFNNLKSACGSVQHQGDNLTGDGEGDDECIFIELSKVDSRVSQLIFVVTIHEAEGKGQHFGLLENAFIRVYNQDNNQEICMHSLEDDFNGYDSVQIGRIYRDGGSWGFEAMSAPFSGGLAALVELYAV
jgi:tellurium resistance protein TerD